MRPGPIQVTDCVSSQTLRRLLDGFALATGYGAAVCDATGRIVSAAQGFDDRTADSVLSAAPIRADGVVIGTLWLLAPVAAVVGAGLEAGGEGQEVEPLALALAEMLSQACEHATRLQERTDELTALAHLSTLLSGRRETQIVLDTVARSVAELMGVKAAAIRLITGEGEMRVVSVHNLSPQYLSKGPIVLARSIVDQKALAGEIVWVEDMASDPRVLYPEDARNEGLASLVCAGMVYRGQPVGVLRIYTEKPRTFSTAELNLLRGVAQLAAAFIRNAQLDAERQEQLRVQRQVEMAAEVQRKLLPAGAPHVPPFEVFGRYEPCFELGGDFYDFIPFTSGVGIVVGDVVGKGVAAGLLMAAVRAYLRAHVEDTYDIDRVMSKVNAALVRDTRDHEFATVFYGTFDSRTRRLTYSSAGHEPVMLLRGGQFMDLDTGGLPLGIDASQPYEKGLIDLLPGDVLLLYTDGVPDASNFQGHKFSRQRIRQALLAAAGGSARDIVNHILWETRRYVGLNHRPDDMTLVAVKVH